MKISILVICYNQEKYIINCLESIRYQIENFGHSIFFQLVVSDDCSNDKTAFYVEKWLNNYNDLFYEKKLIINNTNKGTSENFIDGYRMLNGDRKITISGDDMFTNENIINMLTNIEENEILINPPLIFDDYGIFSDEKKYRYNSFISLLNYHELKNISKYACPITNGAILGKNIINNDVLEFSKNIKYLDDQARYFKIFLNDNLKILKCKRPTLLYRKSVGQITDKSCFKYKSVIYDKYVLMHKINLIEKNPIILLQNLGEVLIMLNRYFFFLFIFPGIWHKYYYIIKKFFMRKKILHLSHYYSKLSKNGKLIIYFNKIISNSKAFYSLYEKK